MKPVIQQDPTGCAIACVAALAGVSYEEVKQHARRADIDVRDPALWTTTRPMIQLLDLLRVNTPGKSRPFESWEALPECALLAVKWREEAGRASWHWVVFVNDGDDRYVLDSNKGLKSNVRRDFGRLKPKWYIPITSAPGMLDKVLSEHRPSASRTGGEGVKPLRSIFQIKVTLCDTQPPIWRRLLVRSDMRLDQLHGVLQCAMGWYDAHLHQFEANGVLFGEIDEEPMGLGFEPEIQDEGAYRLSDLLKRPKSKLLYEYDFGDSWRHDLELEKILPFEKGAPKVRCIKGKRNCPPEDCGGPWGYADLLEALQDPTHEEYEELREWVGEDFDPEWFDLEETNELLAEYW